MKKIFVLFLAIFAMAYFSIPAFAGAAASGTTSGANCIDLSAKSPSDCTDTSNNALVGLSANVQASYYSTDGTNYAAETYNDKGRGKTYGLANLTSNVYVTDGDKTSSLKSDNATTFSSWSVLGQ